MYLTLILELVEERKKYLVYPTLAPLPSGLLHGARYQNVIKGRKLRYRSSWGILGARYTIHLTHSSLMALKLIRTWKHKLILITHNPALQFSLHNYQNSTWTTARRWRAMPWTRKRIAQYRRSRGIQARSILWPSRQFDSSYKDPFWYIISFSFIVNLLHFTTPLPKPRIITVPHEH